MGKTVSSADITYLDFSVLLDLSLATPVLSIENLSTVVNAANLKWVFEVYSPSGIPIHVGSFTTPDIDGVAFGSYEFSEQIPKFFGQIEFSQSKSYTVKVSVKDDAGVIFDLTKGASLCKPNGNNGKNNFGAAVIDITTKCAQGQLFVTDATNLIYKSITGTNVSTTVELTYPKDDNDNTLDPVIVTSIPCLLPIKYEGEGHEVYAVHIYDYDLGDGFVVRIRYSYRKEFAVWCNVTLQPLFCEIDPIVSLLEKQCDDTALTRENNKKLNIVNAKMLKAHTGIVQPLSGIDVPKIVEEIKEILGVDCECCRPQGISNVGVALLTDAVLTTNKVCGDMLLSWSNDGNGNIVLNYQNATYTFVMSDDSESNAFEFVSTANGCAKQIALKVTISTLAQEFVTEIESNQSLQDQLNAILVKAQLSCTIDGGDIFDFDACNYSVEVPTTPTGTAMGKVVINATDYTAPGGTLATDAATIQTWLNSLALGTFVVAYNSGTNKTTITSAANTNTISTISTTGTAGTRTYLFNSDCGLVCSILQRIVTYLNAFGLINIKSGVELSICTFDTNGNVVVTVLPDTTTAQALAIAWSGAICNIVNYMKDKLANCASIKAIFADFTDATGDPVSGDIILGTRNGNCQKYPLKNVAIGILKLIQNDSDVKAQYCYITPCSSVSDCSPVTNLAGVLTDTTASYSWTSVLGATGYRWSIDGINWNLVGATFANVTGLTAATDYTFRVYPVYASGDGTDCVITNDFTTTNTGSGCAAPASFTIDSQTDTTISISWAALTGASGYQYRLNGGSWVSVGNVLAYVISGLTPSTGYNVDLRAMIGGEPCVDISSDSTTTDDVINYVVSAAYSMSIDSVTGTGIPSLPTTGVNGNQSGHHTTVSGTLAVVITGATVPGTSLLAYKGSPITILDTVDISAGPGTYNLTGITVAESEYLSISIII